MMNYTIFDFTIFYGDEDYDRGFEPQHRFVVAETEAEAEQKLLAYFEELRNNGYRVPVYYTDPLVELENVI